MNNYDEMTIDLLDLAKRLLKKWKTILLVGLIFALLGNIYFVYKEYRESKKTWELLSTLSNDLPECTYSIANTALKMIPEDNPYDTSKITNVINAIEKYDSYNNEINSTKDKIEKSYFLKLDTDLVPTIDLYYLITVTSTDWEHINENQKTADVSTIVSNVLKSEEVVTNLLDSLGLDLDPLLFKDLISIWSTNDILTIRVYGQTREECEKIVNQYREIINNNIPEINKSLKDVNFTLTYIGTNYIESDGRMVISSRNAYYDTISAVEKKITDMKKTLETDELKLFNDILTVRYVSDHGTSEEIEEFYTHKNSIISIKGIALGLFIGIFCACGYYVFDYIRGGKLRVPDDLSQLYGLADCKSIENIKSIMQKRGYNRLAVLGVAKDKIELESAPLAEADAALIAEQIDITIIKDVGEEVELCNQHEVPILGYILAE